jgi:hypothetical protein
MNGRLPLVNGSYWHTGGTRSDIIVFRMLICRIICNRNNGASSRAIIVSYTSIVIGRFPSLFTNIATIL